MSLPVRIAVDALGGDYAPQAAIGGVLQALKADTALSVQFVATPDVLRRAEQQLREVSGQVTFVTSGAAVPDGDHPAVYLRRHPDASIAVAVGQVKEGAADAALGVGHTGSVMIAARWILGTLPGIERPAAAGALPIGAEPVLVDLGTSAEADARELLTFAALGSAYARALKGVEQPRVALLSNGRERGKGTRVVQAAYDLFRERVPNFIGYREANDMVEGDADVVVADGYIGNLVLKWMEGIARRLIEIGGATGELAAQIERMRDMTLSRLPIALLGVPGVVMPGHGRSQPADVARLLMRASDAVRGRLPELVRQEVAHFLGEVLPSRAGEEGEDA
ncbi:MAG: hypothetical protein M0Z66_09755 [Thermaerobacter sp.]|nr:hypothetical protein [Thermaerobacter sp.]